jgi:hypothetical protein
MILWREFQCSDSKIINVSECDHKQRYISHFVILVFLSSYFRCFFFACHIIMYSIFDVDWRGFGGRDLTQPTGKFPEGARQSRLNVLATGRKQSTPIIHLRRCAYDNGSEIGSEGWVRWVRTGSVG